MNNISSDVLLSVLLDKDWLIMNLRSRCEKLENEVKELKKVLSKANNEAPQGETSEE